jgi:hypothetical protein
MRAIRSGSGTGWALVLALALLLAACGGGGGGGAPAPTAGGGTPPSGGGGGGGGSTPVPGWNPSVRISNLRDNFTEMFVFSAALTSQNVGFVAWTERAFGTNCARTWVNRYAGGFWGAPTQIGIEQAVSSMVAANANGDAVLVWIENAFSGENCGGTVLVPGVWASRYSAASNTWTPPARISTNPTGVFVGAPSVVIDATGRATAVWIQTPVSTLPTVVWTRFNGTTWSAPAALSDGTRGVAEPVMAQDGSGNVLVLWQQQTNLFNGGLPSGGPMLPNIWFARYAAAAGTWSTPVKLSNLDVTGTGTDTAVHARIAVNASENAVAVWSEVRSSVGSIVSARYSAGSGTWTSPVLIENNPQTADRPEVAIDVNGNAQAVWTQKIDASQTNASGYTARFDAAAGTWGAPLLFEQSTESAFAPVVGMDNTGRALIAWEQTAAAGTLAIPIHAVHYTPASGFGTQMDFAGNNVVLAVNGGGTGLLASDVPSFEPAPIFLGISIRASIFLP